MALYTVIATEEQQGKEKDKLEKIKVGWVILVTPDFRKAYPIDINGIEKTVLAFRDALRSDKYDPQPLALERYRHIFLQTSDKQKTTLAADLETYLGKQTNKTLMWSLDGVLRYVPMAALHDGKNYLVDRYRNVIFNTASLPSLKDSVSKNWQALGYGVTEAREEDGKNFIALSGAERELRTIIRDSATKAQNGILPGTVKLNKDFTKESLMSGLLTGAPLVHIASHFSYDARTPKNPSCC